MAVTIRPFDRFMHSEIYQLVALYQPLVEHELSLYNVERFVGRLDTTFTYIACAGTKIVGAASLMLAINLDGIGGRVENVVVDSDYQKQGIGRRLMEALIERAKHHGLNSLDLTSKPTRIAANALYLGLGFELRQTNAYRLDLSVLSAP